jgi:drug/metabolite transporter (DMT)-like permease
MLAGLDRRALVAYVLVCTVWGSTFLAIRWGVAHLPPLLFAGVRHLTAGILLGAVVLWRGLPRPASWSEAAWLASGGLFFMTISNGSVVWSEQFVPSGVASVYVVMLVVWTALADALIPGGQSRITFRRTAASPFTVAAMQMATGGAALVLLGLVKGELPAFRLDATGAAALAYLIVAGSIVGFGAYVYALRHMSATALGTYAYVNPVVAVALGWLLGHEALTPRMLLAMALMLGAAALIQFGDRLARLAPRAAPVSPDAAP